MKYKCNNPDCNHTWASDDKAFECPNPDKPEPNREKMITFAT